MKEDEEETGRLTVRKGLAVSQSVLRSMFRQSRSDMPVTSMGLLARLLIWAIRNNHPVEGIGTAPRQKARPGRH